MADLGKVKFRVHGKRYDNGREYDGIAEMTLYESGAFAYGNRTGMSLVFDGNESGTQHFDTRYEKFSVKTWAAWAKVWLQNYVAEGLLVEEIKDEQAVTT